MSVDSKYHDINDFNKLSINKNSSFATLHLNIASLSKNFENLQNFLSLWIHSFDIIGISEHKINKNSMNIDLTQPGYTFYFNETESSHEGIGFFLSDNLTFKQSLNLLINEPRRLESTFTELIFPNKRNMICDFIYKHPNMKISRFNNQYLMPLLTNIQKEEKTCMLTGDFNINLLNTKTNTNISEFYNNMPSHFFALYILQPPRLTKKTQNTH